MPRYEADYFRTDEVLNQTDIFVSLGVSVT